MARDKMRDVLTRNTSNDLMLKSALEAIGYTDGRRHWPSSLA